MEIREKARVVGFRDKWEKLIQLLMRNKQRLVEEMQPSYEASNP